ncbi:MAG: YabP/YqfC family sporulation protein [Clostridia bacterium]|nr:YabP/YqfC family sporulation protein [Clostridia bacterium]
MPRKKRTAGQEPPEEKTTLRERVADAVDLSKEVLLDTVLISCIGNRELTLENYKSILAYSDTCIRVKTNPRVVEITGSHLEIRNITRELLYITGRIDQFSFRS